MHNRAGLDTLELRKLSCPYWHLNPGPLSSLIIMYNYTKYLPQMMQIHKNKKKSIDTGKL
jgi:hypothetical protein